MKKTIVHPRLGEITVAKGRQVKRLSVSVRPPACIRLNVPSRCSMRAAMEFLSEKEEWIATTLAKVAQKYPSRVLQPPYSTYSHVLEFCLAADVEEPAYRITSDTIRVCIPLSMQPSDPNVQEVAAQAVVSALRAEAKEVLPGMVAEAAVRYGFNYGKVSVRASRSRWGSCSYRDDISLSIFLMRLPRHLIWYVVVHELCHTRHKDHSPEFHHLLDSLVGGREKQLRRELLGYNPGIF